ncbi:hypothetical protein V5F59_07160 [Xanthobacter autotrophicus DSM 431]|uniref:hypothetical protein n=1 Tax=Xanthobacter nonsaccharivorans TaxID=3119912 RepID=UPI00372B4001
MFSLRAASLAIVSMAGAMICAMPAAQAQDRCTAYANEMVGLDQRARQMRCPGWASHSNWDGHYQWCTTKSPAQTKDALDTWGAKFDGCATSYGGQGGGYKPPPPANAPKQDASRAPVCKSYAQALVTWRNKAIAKGCNVGVNMFEGAAYSEPEAFNWCMATSDASFRQRSPQALGYKAGLEKACSAQLKRPIKL